MSVTFPEPYLTDLAAKAGFTADEETLVKVRLFAAALFTDIARGHKDIPPPPCPNIAGEPT